jgi:hypothetical protein
MNATRSCTKASYGPPTAATSYAASPAHDHATRAGQTFATATYARSRPVSKVRFTGERVLDGLALRALSRIPSKNVFGTGRIRG